MFKSNHSLGGGLTEDDILGSSAREPFRSCCIALADRIWALFSSSSDLDNTATTSTLAPLLQPVVSSLRLCANTEATSTQNGQLDTLLVQIAHIIDPEFPRNILETSTSTARVEALEVLVSAVQAATTLMMIMKKKRKKKISSSSSSSSRDNDVPPLPSSISGGGDIMEVEYDPGSIAISAALRDLAGLLNIDEDIILTGSSGTGTQSSSSAMAIAASIKEATQQTVASLPPGIFAPLLSPGSLNDAQLVMLKEVDEAFKAEYSLRRKMLIERARVTLQSLLSSKKLDRDSGQVRTVAEAAAQAAEGRMEVEPKVTLADCFTVTISDLLPVMEKGTSGSGVRSRIGGSGSGKSGGGGGGGGGSIIHASVKSVIIGAVPDRGGRTEGRGRVADMPAWSARRAGGRGGRRGGGGGGGRGGNNIKKNSKGVGKKK